MSNKFYFVLLLGVILSISAYANRRTRQLAKLENELEEYASVETYINEKKKLDEFTVFVSSQYDRINHKYVRNFTFVEDLVDISLLDENKLKQAIIKDLISQRALVDALLAVGGSMRYVYTGDTSFQSVTIELSYWDLNNVPYF